MEECFKCHAPETKALLFDIILPNGISKICGKCTPRENMPIIKDAVYPGFERQQTVAERLARISGVTLTKRPTLKIEEKTKLRKLVEENYNFKDNLELKKDLIRNFHWIVMRVRRIKHLTRKQLAEEIHEPERVIERIEQGFAPEKENVITKLEKHLGIRLREKVEHEEFVEELREELSREFDIRSFDDLTIEDLHKMKKLREADMLESESERNEIERDEKKYEG